MNWRNWGTALSKRKALAVVIFCVGLCWPVAAGAAYSVTERLSVEFLYTIIGVMVALVIMVVSTGCLTLVVIAYSNLRRKEEAEDDWREMKLVSMMRNRPDKLAYPEITYIPPESEVLVE